MHKKKLFIVKSAALTIFLLASAAYALLHIEKHVKRVNVSNKGSQADCEKSDFMGYCGDGNEPLGSYDPVISPDGRYIAFESTASNLVTGDSNDSSDIFVRDRVSGITQRVSLSNGGGESNEDSWDPSISADGRYVVFQSNASNLVAGDTNNEWDIYVRDRVAQTTSRVSVSTAGKESDYHSYTPSISADGRYIAFASSNLVPGDPNCYDGYYYCRDIYVRDRVTRTIENVSVSTDGEQANGDSWGPSISANNRYVAFESEASNLVAGDTNGDENYYGGQDIFIHDRVANTTERISLSNEEEQANSSSGSPSISANGRYVAFISDASNLVTGDSNDTTDIFIRDRVTGSTERISISTDGEEANNYSDYPSISANGRYVVFYSEASNLVAEDSNETADIFIRDRVAGTTKLVSISHEGKEADGRSRISSISANGQYIAFGSRASNLVKKDTNDASDIFIYYETSYETPDKMSPGVYLLLQDDPE